MSNNTLWRIIDPLFYIIMCWVMFQINEMGCLVVDPGVGSETFKYETQAFDVLIEANHQTMCYPKH